MRPVNILVIFIVLISFLPQEAKSQMNLDSMVKISLNTNSSELAVVWPGDIPVVPPYEFADQKELTSVSLSEGVEEIGEYAFLGCTNLREVILPSTLKIIGEGAFRDCPSLVSLVLPEGIKEIPPYMCAWDENLQEVCLPQSVVDIGKNAFSYCSKLDSISFPCGLKHIGPNAFSFCKGLKTIEIPDSMRELESYAFSGCENLIKAKLPSNPNMLGELIFTGCGNLKEIICLSAVPPTFDCNSPLFDPLETDLWKNCRLLILPDSKSLYSMAPGWDYFFQTD